MCHCKLLSFGSISAQLQLSILRHLCHSWKSKKIYKDIDSLILLQGNGFVFLFLTT